MSLGYIKMGRLLYNEPKRVTDHYSISCQDGPSCTHPDNFRPLLDDSLITLVIITIRARPFLVMASATGIRHVIFRAVVFR